MAAVSGFGEATLATADSSKSGRWGRTAKVVSDVPAPAHQTASVDVPVRKGRWRAPATFAHESEPSGASSPDEACANPIPGIPALMREGPDRAGLGCTIRLRRGLQMPQMGLGGGSLDGNEGRDAVAAALIGGQRLIDTALYYGNERDIAAGIKLAGIHRSDVFIATKLLQKAHATEAQVRWSLAESLKNLATNYVDLYLIHNPRAGRIKQVWPLLLEMRDRGLIRVAGVSNFGVAQLEGMRRDGLELPEVNQIEVHCWRQLPEVIAYHQQHGIATMCMAPLARGQLFGQTELVAIASQLGRSEAEVAIRWSLQRGFIPIPKSIRPERIRENTAQGFDLSPQQMARIERLDCTYMSCKVASPCHELPWDMVADSIPDPSVWGGKKPGGSGRGYGRR